MAGTEETSLGGQAREFPSTIWDLVDRACDGSHPQSRESLEEIVRLYWKPVYAYVRESWAKTNEDAKDLTQGFFLELVEKNLLEDFDRKRYRLRTCLKKALQHFLIDENRIAKAKKRGGGLKILPLDFAWEEGARTPRPGSSSQDVFDSAWVASLMEQALAELGRRFASSGRGLQFKAFRRYLDALEAGSTPAYADLARELSVGEHDVANYLHRARLELRRIVVERVRQQVSSPDELEGELRHLFGGAGE